MILKYPFQINSYGKVDSEIDSEKEVEQLIGEYFLSQQGQRPMQQYYGSNSHSLLFETADPLLYEEFKMESLAEVARQVPQVSILALDIYDASNLATSNLTNALGIRVSYQFPFSNMVKVVSYTITDPLQLTEDTPL